MKTILIFTQNLSLGGVQKSVSSLANFLSKFYKIIIVLAEDNKEIQYKLNKCIDIHKIKTKKFDITKKNIGIKILNYRIKQLDKILHQLKPNLVFSYEDYNNIISLKTNYNTKRIVSVRVNIDMYKNKNIHLLNEEFYKQNIKKLYKQVKITAVSKAIQKDLPKAKVIENGISKQKHLKNEYTNYILNVGRLDNQKGQSDLIQAFNIIKDKIIENLIIVGDGVLRDHLTTLVENLEIEDRVMIVGFDDPWKYYKNASLFVFPSYYEGFPNALIEAMKSNIPILSYNFKGSDEILSVRVKIGDVKTLSQEMLSLLNNKAKRKKNIMENSMQVKKFRLSKTLRRYKKEIDLCVV